ncbi:ThiJ/PfpI family protein [Drepanopeziza brunnea f. sp. 'multigermtubi' MB_m1]|uniref:ThiJ/PfpI family protein n=1 Tax=Marssonina brunnea f. sp. multigermtubi (strain MB_m1) TaxID=1072389 RepID=K1X116_MARBU|nr:ThiJ/PfpI family protein [Drepanopeziza brunnea f. sp. 'multigermtubi' MB_m1]EKD18926.1 ThiJ/PfpI family protein [Drepanopeziza brunnea f. sp. 'multigermtubi' MB_m1]
MDILDLTGPFEALSWATHPPFSNPNPDTDTLTAPAFTHRGLGAASAQLVDFEILVVPGGNHDEVLPTRTEPIPLIARFAALPPRSDGRVRTILSVCTTALFLREAGVLDGLTATMHPHFEAALGYGGRQDRGGEGALGRQPG